MYHLFVLPEDVDKVLKVLSKEMGLTRCEKVGKNIVFPEHIRLETTMYSDEGMHRLIQIIMKEKLSWVTWQLLKDLSKEKCLE